MTNCLWRFSQEYQLLDTCPRHKATATIFTQKQKLKAFSLQTWPGFYFTEYQRTPLPNQPVFLWRCLQTGQGRLPQWGRMPLSERSWRAQMLWWAEASKLAASAVWMHCYLDTWKVGLLLLWEQHFSWFSFSSWWEKGVISLCWRVFQLRYCLYC